MTQRTYIVRIYRQGVRTLVGVVEDAGTQAEKAFGSIEELGELLREPIEPAQHAPGTIRPHAEARERDAEDP
jgi:hypothetical protein